MSRSNAAAQPATEAYPNPVDERINLPAATGPYTFYDGHGQAVREGKTARVLDTRKLPDGLYYLVHQDASGRAVRQAIEVKH
ncbi:T9SS type A sorting domain-containing protein [Hymenobacter siberiensis]|jgi:hypothetical protein|uniref:T9SS type A sorting domain-containing protein n=1 Tax=Hymenobacter siberiensis TaxID=2848396 RepID=UPI001C1E8414|nr:T9SS type A sorting domain-containing protein [Hymenobacter siberiensis]